MSSRLKHSILGFLTDSGGQFLLTAATFIITPLILHLTSVTLYGFWMTILSVLAYLGLADLGIGLALVRLVVATENQQEDVFNRVVSTAFFTFVAAGVVFIAVGLAVSNYIPAWFHIPPAESKILLKAYSIAVISGAIGMPLSVFGAIVVGVQRMAIANVARIASSLVSVGISIVLLYAGFSITALALSLLLGVLISAAVNYKYAVHYKPNLKIRLSLVNRADFNRLFSFGGYFQLGQVANIVATSADSIIIATMIGASAVTPYLLTSKMAAILSITVACKLPGTLFPAISQMFIFHEMEKLKRVFIMLAAFASRLAIVGALFIALSNERFVSLWVGSELYGGTMLNVVFVYWVIQDTIFRGTSVFIQASGDMRIWAIVSIIEAVVNIVVSLSLVGSLGLVGVAIGTSIARTPSSIYILYVICKKIGLPVKKLGFQGILYPMMRSMPGCIIAIICAYLLPISLGWFWICAVGAGAAILNIVSFEGIALAKPSEEPFSIRLQQLFIRIS